MWENVECRSCMLSSGLPISLRARKLAARKLKSRRVSGCPGLCTARLPKNGLFSPLKWVLHHRTGGARSIWLLSTLPPSAFATLQYPTRVGVP
ncbi:hypothetical protein F751_2906 [Auxenochlorella protothecoides]|uniref:Uncharacterized protein n=1 Tax=Auxenochlorella protothecoides TaxID=3075 RepID=A0A087SD43_AUXPR|nr:hypothetical protein F751_2906 [Auxenochlorella protothecoides]KFM23647.1 hypothetical protein F751_2906 [Auxenochlorella protothecoides]